MKHLYFILGLIAALLTIAGTAFAVQYSVPSAPGFGYILASTSTGAYTASTTEPLYIGRVLSTSTTASQFPYASSTALSAPTFCIGTDCRTAWPASASGVVGTISTSSQETKGQLPYFTTTNGYPAQVGVVSTSSISSGTGISFTGTPGAQVGGTALTITNSGVISLTNGTGINCSGTNPGSCSLSIPVSIANGGTGASSLTADQVPYTNHAGTALVTVATSSVSAGTGISLSASPGALIGGSALTITNNGVISLTNGTGINCSGTNPGSCSIVAPVSIANGGTNSTSLGTHMILTTNASSIVASSTPTAAAYLATSTTATSTFQGGFNVGGAPGFQAYTTGLFAFGTTTTKDPNGNVTLTIQTNGGSDPLVLTDGTTKTGYFINSADTTQPHAQWGSLTNDDIGFFTNNAVAQWSYLRNGNGGFGTTTPAWLLQLSTSTGAGIKPQLALSDQAAAANQKHWTLRSVSGNLYIATSSDALATSTVAAFLLDKNGYVYFPSIQASSGNNCLQIDATGKITNTGSACGSSTGLTSYDAFTHPSNYGVTTSATTSPLWLQGTPYSGFASSTVIFNDIRTTYATTTYASTTAQSISNSATVGTTTQDTSRGAGLAVGTTTVIGSAQAATYFASTTCSSICTINWNNGNKQTFLLTGNSSFVINSTSSNPIDGAGYLGRFCQDSVGSRTLTFVTPDHLRWPTLGATPGATTTISSAANSCSFIGWVYDGVTTMYSAMGSTTGISRL